MILSFLRNKVMDVSQEKDGSLRVSWRLTDNFWDAGLEMVVTLPDLEIRAASGTIRRSPYNQCGSAPELLSRVVGVRVGAGLRKIVEGLVGGPSGCPELAEGVLECCNAVILHFTVPQLQATEKGTEEQKRESFQTMLRLNPRLVRSCVAFAEDSPLMQGLV